MVISLSAAAAAAKEEACRLLGLEPVASLPVQRPGPTCELASTSFLRPDAEPVRLEETVDYTDYELLAEINRTTPHWSEEALAIERRIVLKALELYNAMHPGNEYELAPGEMTRSSDPEPAGDCVWSHGNFVARRRKRSGCFSFLPAPRTLFFFEHVSRADFHGAVTCIRLDEPDTGADNFFGFPLGWGTHCNGDCVCKTCYRRFDVLYQCLMKTYPCGQKVEAVCQMCYRRSDVLHPHRGEFEFGYHK